MSAKKWLMMPVLLAAALLPFSPAASKENEEIAAVSDKETDSDWSGSIESDFVSRYIWRGIPIGSGWALQPTATLAWQDLSGQVWANYNLAKDPYKHEISEVDLNLIYDREWGPLHYTPALYFYFYPHQAGVKNDGEFSLRLGWLVWLLEPYLLQSFSLVNNWGGYYGEFGTAGEKKIANSLTLRASLGFGWGSPEFNRVNLECSDWAANALLTEWALNWHLYPHLFLRPHLSYSYTLDRSLRRQIRQGLGRDADNLAYGLALGAEF